MPVRPINLAAYYNINTADYDIISTMKKPRSRKLKKHAYTAAQWTWGLPQTLIGAALYVAHHKDDHFDYRGAKATAWDKDTGISLGKFIFVPRRAGGSHFIFWQSGLHRCFGTGFRISKINAERQASRTIRLRSKKQPILLLHYPIKERSETHIKKPKLRIMKLRLAAPCSVLFKNEVISPVPFRSQDPF